MTVYLLHLKHPLAHARHYLGWTDDLVGRLLQHGTRQGARLLEVAAERGITWTLARTWEGEGATRTFERRLKNNKHTPRLCPVCNPNALQHFPELVPLGRGRQIGRKV